MGKVFTVLLIVCTIIPCAAQPRAENFDKAIANATASLKEKCAGSKVAILNIQSEHLRLSRYVIESLSASIVSDKSEDKMVEVDRRELESLQREKKYQLSGEVADEEIQSIGKQLGAQFVITGSIELFKDTYLLRIKATEISSAHIVSNRAFRIKKDETVAELIRDPRVKQTDGEDAQDTANKTAAPFARKYFEMGFGAAAGFSNNFIGAGDIFKKNVEIDLDILRERIGEDGVDLDFNVWGDVFFFNVNMQGNWGFGLCASVDGGIYTNLPESFFTLIAEGNINNHSPQGDFTVSGGIFADVQLNVHGKFFKKLKIGVTPAMYVPVVYIPKSTISYALKADNTLGFHTTGNLAVYSPFSFDDMKLDLGAIMKGSGFDISLDAEYALLDSFLDVGTTITHIPLSAAVLNHSMAISADFEIEGDNILQDQNIKIPEFELTRTYSDNASYKVYRPLRFDFYALLRPLKTNLFAVRPNIGFTVLNASEEANFNWGLEARLNLKDLFRLQLGTGYEETQWKHRLGLALNLRVFELDIEAGLRSPSFANSFMLQGLSLGAGIRMGW